MMNKWIKEHRNLAIIIFFLFAVIAFLIFAISLDKNYTIFLIFAIIELWIIPKFINEEYMPYILFLLIFVVLGFSAIKLSYMFQLKHSDIPFTTTNVSVIDYEHRSGQRKYRNSFDKYTLLFSDSLPISNHIIRTKPPYLGLAEKGDCLEMKYRENAWLIELRPIENLGQMPTDKCLASSHTP